MVDSAAVFLWRNNDFHALSFGLLRDRITVITTICQQILGSYPLDQAVNLCAIRSGTFGNNNSKEPLIKSGRSSGVVHYIQIRGDNCAS